MPELSNYAICYEAIQRVYRNAITGWARSALEQRYGKDWLARVRAVFQREWEQVIDAAQEIRAGGSVGTALTDDFDCLGVNHFHNLFDHFFDDLFPPGPASSDRSRAAERRTVLTYTREVNLYRNAMSHPSEEDLPERDARRLLDSAHRVLRLIDPDAAQKIFEYEKRLSASSVTMGPDGERQASATSRRYEPIPAASWQRRRPRVSSAQDDVLVVAAGRSAAEDYERYHAYICQDERAFRSVPRMAFYADRVILRHVPTIKGTVESVSFSERGYEDIKAAGLDPATEERAAKLLRNWLKRGEAPHDRDPFKLMLLSGPDDPETFVLHSEVANNKRSRRARRPTAFTQGHRYVSFARLQTHPKETSELELDSGNLGGLPNR